MPRREHDGYTCAADIVVEHTPLTVVYQFAVHMEAFSAGGVGVYTDDTPRLHLDVRGIAQIHDPARWGHIDGRTASAEDALAEDERRCA